HEECAVEEAIQITERLGGNVSVLALGPPDAAEQLRDALALGAGRAVLLETDGREWGPIATAEEIVAEGRRRAEAGQGYDLLLLGNEAADTGDYQVGVRVAHALGWPCVTGIKGIEIDDGGVRARREYRGIEELFEFGLPAVITVKEGINLPRYPSLPGRREAGGGPVRRRRSPGGRGASRAGAGRLRRVRRVRHRARPAARVRPAGMGARPGRADRSDGRDRGAGCGDRPWCRGDGPPR